MFYKKNFVSRILWPKNSFLLKTFFDQMFINHIKRVLTQLNQKFNDKKIRPKLFSPKIF